MEKEIILKKFSERFFNLIKEHDTNIDSLAEKIGIKSKSTIYRYMNGEMAPKITTIKYLAEIFNVNPVWLMGYDVPMEVDKNIIPATKMQNIPVVGKISAGQPILADEHIEGYLPVDPNIYGLSTSDDLFYLKVSGNSMNLKVKNGDYALIHKQNYAENGDIIVAIVNGDDEATMKKYKQINDGLIALEPMSDDPSYEPIYIDKKTNFQIIGKAIGQFGKF